MAVDTSYPPGNEAAVEGVLREALGPVAARRGREVEPAPGRLSLIARLPPGEPRGRTAATTLIVNGHTDVVPAVAAGWAHDPFDPEIADDRLYGRGSADMKGGVAAAICALDTLEAAGSRAGCDIVFQFVADEERGGGARYACPDGVGAAAR